MNIIKLTLMILTLGVMSCNKDKDPQPNTPGNNQPTITKYNHVDISGKYRIANTSDADTSTIDITAIKTSKDTITYKVRGKFSDQDKWNTVRFWKEYFVTKYDIATTDGIQLPDFEFIYTNQSNMNTYYAYNKLYISSRTKLVWYGIRAGDQVKISINLNKL